MRSRSSSGPQPPPLQPLRFLGSGTISLPQQQGGCVACMVSLRRRGLLLSSLLSTSPMPQRLSSLLSPVQLLSSLTECLTVDPLSASVWRQLYPKHLSQSRQVGEGAVTYLPSTQKSLSLCLPACPCPRSRRGTLVTVSGLMPPSCIWPLGSSPCAGDRGRGAVFSQRQPGA